MADDFLHARQFERLGDFAAYLDDGIPSLDQHVVLELGGGGREVGEMDAVPVAAGHVPPYLVSGEGEDRGHQFHQRVQDLVQGRLGAPPLEGVAAARIEPVFEDIEIKRAHLDAAEGVHHLVDDVELVVLVSPEDPLLEGFHLVQRPAVQLGHLSVGHRVGGRVEIADVAQDVAAGVADAAIGLRNRVEDLRGDSGIVPVVLGRGPQAQDVGAELLDNVFGRHHVAHGLAHLAAGAVQHETVGQDIFVGRRAPRSDTHQQGGVKPAPVLVAAFQVHVRGGAEIVARFQHRGVGNAGVEPHIQDVHFLFQVRAAAGRACRPSRQEIRCVTFIPDIGAKLGEQVGNMAHHGSIGEGLAA